MSRRLITLALLLSPAVALADPDDGIVETTAEPDDDGDQAIGGALGLATGGRVTPGGVRITGHYLYQLSESDWFDGIASFTFGGGEAACFRDRMDTQVCSHDFNDGGAIELAGGVRRMFPARGELRPFVRAAVGLAMVRFKNDGVTGIAIPLHLGGGVRAKVAPGVAVVAQGELMAGLGAFDEGLGGEPQLGVALTAGAEFRLP